MHGKWMESTEKLLPVCVWLAVQSDYRGKQHKSHDEKQRRDPTDYLRPALYSFLAHHHGQMFCLNLLCE